MAYRTKSELKGERKIGMAAMKRMQDAFGFDPQSTLALAQQNKDAFEKLDDLDDKSFIACMKDMRENHPDLYPVFWWWRKAEEDAGRRQEDDGDAKPESRYRSFMMTQFLAEPFSDDWEDDRLTLKPGVEPWITQAQIEDGLDHKTIKKSLWCWHDDDYYTEEDELADTTGRIKAGDRKFLHAHIVIDVPAKVSVSTVSRWFNIPSNMIEILRGRGAFLDGVEYLPHESPKAVAQFKTHYDDDKMHASPGFDFRKELTEYQKHRVKYGKRAGEMTPADVMRMHVMQDGWTMKQCRNDDPLTYAKIRNSLPPLRLDYLLDSPPCPFRLNIYVDGPSGIGKTSYCRYIAETLFPNYEHPYFPIGNDERVTFDGYDGQPAIIWNDMRASDFIARFKPSGTYKILDLHPDNEAQQAKNSRVILCNAINIINGIQPFEEFLNGLAGTYIDKSGISHKAEDETQAWRRMPLILCVRENTFDVMINKGFVDHDLSSIKTMIMYANVRGSLHGVMQKLDGAAKQKALLEFGQPVVDAVHMLEEKHNDKISDPDQIPPELMPVRVDVKERFLEEYEAEAEKRFDTLIEFAHWFWENPNFGYHAYVKAVPNIGIFAEDEIDFATNVPSHVLKDAINNYIDYSLLGTFSEKLIRDAIEMAWSGNL